MKNGCVAKKKFEEKKTSTREMDLWKNPLHLKRFDDGGDPLRKRKENKLKKLKVNINKLDNGHGHIAELSVYLVLRMNLFFHEKLIFLF